MQRDFLKESLDEPLDLAWGAKQIGDEINRSPRQVYHMAQSGALADVVVKINGQLAADRRRLRAKFRPSSA